jgi:hypothetical protein
MLQHSRLLGSVFRGDALHIPASEEFEHPLKAAGLLGRDPQSLLIITRRDVEAGSGLRTPKPSSPSISRPSTALRNAIVTPLLRKRKSKATLVDDDAAAAPVDILSEKPPLPTPNILYRKVLNASEPPAPANFTQLSEFLTRIVSGDVDSQHESYEMVFIETIRQYFIECSGQGRLLDRCRLFFTSLARYVPRLRARFVSELSRLDRLIRDSSVEVEQIQQQLTPTEERRRHLQNIVNDLRNDYQLLTAHLDSLNRLIGAATKEVHDMRIDAERLDSRIAEKDSKIVVLNQELRTLDDASARTTAETVEIAESLRGLLLKIEEDQGKIDNSKESILGMKGQLNRINAEIAALQSAIEESNRFVKTEDAGAQTDFAVHAKRSSAISDARRRRQEAVLTVGHPLTGIFTPGSKEVRIPEEGIVLKGYDDFAVLKDLILANSDVFQWTPNEIKCAEDGNFEPDNSPPDFLRLYASRLVSDVLDRSLKKGPMRDLESQTLATAPQAEREESPGIAAARGNKFLMQIPADYSQRPPQTLEWMLKNIRMIYDEKWQDDLQKIEKVATLTPLFVFAFQIALRSHPLTFVAYQFCWDLHITGKEFRDSSIEVDMFMSALAEGITVEQLAFMLKCRDHIMKVGTVVSLRVGDQQDQVTEYYVSQDQIESALLRWWKHRYRPRILQHCMEYAVARPAMHLEATKRYIAMNGILSVMILEFAADTIAQMHELLQRSRLVPRLAQSPFGEFIRSMLPFATDQDCDRFYRATVSKTCLRTEVSQKKFRALFAAGSILYAHEEQPEQEIGLKELRETVGQEWNNRKDMIVLIRKFFEKLSSQQTENLTMRTLVGDAQRFEGMLIHSLTIKNATEACLNYFQLVFTLDLLFSVLPHFGVALGDASLASLECCIQEYWLDSIFQKDEQHK